jgi:hypothetical protein
MPYRVTAALVVGVERALPLPVMLPNRALREVNTAVAVAVAVVRPAAPLVVPVELGEMAIRLSNG